MCFLKDGIANSSGKRLGEHAVEGIGFLDDVIVSISSECVRDVDGGD